ncbi:MAG: hypothetical protein NC453_26415 [Muribaculum sp.]|nr:hypothetical protein [Muribaculum sp.]
MSDLFNILPLAILYLAGGFVFLCGFYLWIDRRFDFLSEISFSIMLVVGYLLDTIARSVPINFGFTNESARNLVFVFISFICGMGLAVLRNTVGGKVSKFVIRYGRRKSSSEFFWYDILDEKDKPTWIRLTNLEKQYILDGVLLSLAETKDNPYLLLGYCQKYNLDGTPIDNENVNANDKHIQKIVRPDSFDEITLFYADNSSKAVEFNIDNR